MWFGLPFYSWYFLRSAPRPSNHCSQVICAFRSLLAQVLVPWGRKVRIFGGARCGLHIVNNGSDRMSALFGPEWSPDHLGEVPELHFGSILEPFGAHFGTAGPFFEYPFSC